MTESNPELIERAVAAGEKLAEQNAEWREICTLLRQENARLRVIICECARVAGAALSPQASVEFMAELPAEIAARIRRNG